MNLSFIEILKVIFLGIVEGITEWLPISSTGHMLLVDEFLQLNASDSFKEMFFIIIQLGAILAVVVLYWNRMFPFQFKDKAKPVIRKDILNFGTVGCLRVFCCPIFLFPLSRWTLKCVILGENDAHRRDDHAI